MKIGIIGCSGRMGVALIDATITHSETTLTGGTVRADSLFVGEDLGKIARLDPVGINAGTHLETLFNDSDAVIDFSTPETSLEAANIAAKTKTIHIIGTTGFTAEEFDTLQSYAKKATMVWSSNMSVGINLLANLVEQAAAQLQDDYDIEVLEMHHCHKMDAPSGTALSLGEAAARGRNIDLHNHAVRSRDGITGPREQGTIGFATLRGGDVVGEHHVIFASDGERIELSHKASSRRIFAKGAIRAALWAKDQPAGWYSMKDVLASR